MIGFVPPPNALCHEPSVVHLLLAASSGRSDGSATRAASSSIPGAFIFAIAAAAALLAINCSRSRAS